MEKQIIEILNNLKIDNKNKKIFGEVFTPVFLINDMLDKLPVDVWKNEKLKWLDPASGIGNFSIIVYYRLMESLKEVFKNREDRSKHIIENMLYMVELNPINYKKSIEIFNRLDKNTKPNINCNDFLLWKNDINFDIIIGNPPYNASQEGLEGKKRGGGASLWHHFVKKCIKILKKDGYLVFVNPTGWRKPASVHSRYKIFFKLMAHEHTMLYLQMHNLKDGIKIFNAGTRFDFYVIKKTPNTNFKTKILDETKKVNFLNLNEWSWLPNSNFDFIKKFIIKTDELPPFKNSKVCFSYLFEPRKPFVNKVKTDIFKYPLIKSTNKSGIVYLYTSRKEGGHYGISKVIFGESGINKKVIIDMEGKYSMSNQAYGLRVDNLQHAKDLKKALESDAFGEIIKQCSFGNFRIDWRIFCYFKPDWYKIFL